MAVVIGLVIAFVLVAVFAGRGTRACRWRALRRGADGAIAKYRCAACGAEVVTSDGRTPRRCFRDRPGPGEERRP